MTFIITLACRLVNKPVYSFFLFIVLRCLGVKALYGVALFLTAFPY